MSNKIISGKIQAISNRTFGVMINSVWYGCPTQILSTLKKGQEITFTSDEQRLIGLLPTDTSEDGIEYIKPAPKTFSVEQRDIKIFKCQCLNIASQFAITYSWTKTKMFDFADELFKEGEARGYLK